MFLSVRSLEDLGNPFDLGSGRSELRAPELSMNLGFVLHAPLSLLASLQGALRSHGQSSRTENVSWSSTSWPIMFFF